MEAKRLTDFGVRIIQYAHDIEVYSSKAEMKVDLEMVKDLLLQELKEILEVI